MRKLYVILILPLICYFAIFLIYPSCYAVKLSFTSQLGYFPTLSNFAKIFKDPLFWISLRNNIIVPVISVIIELTAGLGIALLLSRKFMGRGTIRAIAILPFAVPEIVFLTIMRFIFAEHGYLNGFLHVLGVTKIYWLQPKSWLALLTICLVDAWHVTPIVFLILLAGLEGIPKQLYEAARIDGASDWSVFHKITLPLLTPSIVVALVLRSVDAFRIFATPLVLTGFEGAPFMSTYAYHFWTDYSNKGISNAAAVVLALVILSLSYFYLKLWRKSEEIL